MLYFTEQCIYMEHIFFTFAYRYYDFHNIVLNLLYLFSKNPSFLGILPKFLLLILLLVIKLLFFQILKSLPVFLYYQHLYSLCFYIKI